MFWRFDGIVFECDYCGNNVLDSQESVDGLHHDICQDEWNKRYNSGMCVGCGGQRDRVHFTRCSKCTKVYQYSNYKGPQL